MQRFMVKIEVPVTLYADENVDTLAMRCYLDDVLNMRDNKGQGRRCFNGEMVRHALDNLFTGVLRAVGVDGELYLSEEKGSTRLCVSVTEQKET